MPKLGLGVKTRFLVKKTKLHDLDNNVYSEGGAITHPAPPLLMGLFYNNLRSGIRHGQGIKDADF